MGTSVSKSLGRNMGWFVLSRLLSSLKGNTPLATHRRRAEALGRLGLHLMRSRSKVMVSNLASVFPDLDPEERNRILRESVNNICRGFVDLFYYVHHQDVLPDQVVLEDNGVLDGLLERKCGCIVATGHVGLFPVLGIPMVRRGLQYAPVARDPRDPRLKKVFNDSRTLLGYTNIPDHPPMTVLKRSLQVLRSGGVVNITFDMRPRDGAVDVEFLGRRTPMYSAVVRIAATTGLPIVPGYVIRDRGMHRVTYFPPINVPKEAMKDTSPAARKILQLLAAWLSDAVRAHPDQYWWVHRRWR